jgi:hypothetical protein
MNELIPYQAQYSLHFGVNEFISLVLRSDVLSDCSHFLPLLFHPAALLFTIDVSKPHFQVLSLQMSVPSHLGMWLLSSSLLRMG